jgi:cytochrome c oxidase subunit 3
MADASQPEMQFATLAQQEQVARLGMWVFLSTEVLFFGGLFLSYAVYRGAYPEGFAAAARHTDIVIGTVNTAILLTSSFLVAWGADSIKHADGRFGGALLTGAAFLGLLFLGLKAVEYSQEYREHLIPGLDFAFVGPQFDAALLFFTFYFVVTILHAIHLTIGIVALVVVARRGARGRYGDSHPGPVTGTALYWHFVDLVWIFLFAMIYLPGRSGA